MDENRGIHDTPDDGNQDMYYDYDDDFGEDIENRDSHEDNYNEDYQDGYDEGYSEEYEDDYYDEDYEDDYDDMDIPQKILYRIQNLDDKIKILGASVLVFVFIIGGIKLFKTSKPPKVNIPTMVAMSIENLPLDEDGNIIDPIYDEEGNLIGIPVHIDLQPVYGEYYYFDAVEQEDPLDLDAWADEQVKNPNEVEVEEIEEPVEPVNYDVAISELPASFYSKDPDNSKIKETNYRNLGVEPKHKSENNFIVYNWQGNLSPLNREGDYINREILGRVLDYDMFTVTMEYQVDMNDNRIDSDDLPAFFSNDFDRETAVAKAKAVYEELKKEGVYKDLELRTEDYAVNYIINLINSANKSREDASSYYIPNAEFDLSKGDFQRFQYELVEQILKDMGTLGGTEFTNEYLGKVHYKLYNYIVNAKLDYYKGLACEELNEYKKGLCSLPKDISSLEIKSDFIQEVYSSSLQMSIEHFYYVMYRVYDRVNPIN